LRRVNGNSLANILGMSDIVANYRVILDSLNGNFFAVHISDSEVMVFKRLSNGLYDFDTSVDKVEPFMPDTHVFLLICI